MLEIHEMKTLTERHLKEIVKLADSSDPGLRTNAIDVCVILYNKFIGEEFWNTYKEVLNQKSIDMIKSRLKNLGMLQSEEPVKKVAEIRKAMTSPNRNSNLQAKKTGLTKTPVREKPLA